MREKPYGIPDALWEQFNEWADGEGIAEDKEDWGPWWACWINGCESGQLHERDD